MVKKMTEETKEQKSEEQETMNLTSPMTGYNQHTSPPNNIASAVCDISFVACASQTVRKKVLLTNENPHSEV